MNNFSYSNFEYEKNYSQNPPAITDGNGIIIDSDMQPEPPSGYHGRTFVGNNVVSGNGGSGAHTYYSQHVDFVANTAYQNNQSVPKPQGQMFSNSGADIMFYNNILTPFQSYPYMQNNYNTDSVTENYNLLDNFNVKAPGSNKFVMSPGSNDITGNPQFNNVTAGNFNLNATSVARGTATSNLEPTSDIVGLTRPQAHGYDIGAYESTAP